MVAPLRVVVTDPIVSRLETLFRELAAHHDWQFVAHLSPEEQSAAISSADVLICARLEHADAQRCDAALVHVTGTGTDRVAVNSLNPQTRVLRTGHHERSIAEHLLMVTMAHQRRLLQVAGQLRGGEWRSVATDPTVPMHRNLNELVIGFVGFGGIGRQSMELFAALGASGVAVRRSPTAEDAQQPGLQWIKPMEHLPELLAVSDVVVLGVPLTEETTGLIGATQLRQMRPDALFINVSRGPVIDQDDLYQALQDSVIGGAALDVWWDAPQGMLAPPSVARFSGLPNVIATAHNSGHALHTFESRVRQIVANIAKYSDHVATN